MRISPSLGSATPQFFQLVDAIHAKPDTASKAIACELRNCRKQIASGSVSFDEVKFLFVCSLLHDIQSVGGGVWIRDSQLQATWPKWDGQDGRANIRKALLAARDLRALRRDEIERVSPMFCGDTDGDSVCDALEEGKFWLEPASSVHPSGVKYSEGFSAALRLWSMPYRGRQGRGRRFVLLCKHPSLSEHPVIAGLIEMGDEAPFCRWRDHLMGLSVESLNRFTSTLTPQEQADFAKESAIHLQSIRGTILDVEVFPKIQSQPADEIVGLSAEVASKAHGRSIEDDGLYERKRLAHALRLAQGEAAFQRLAKVSFEELGSDQTRFLAAGVRALKDLVTPRVHMEVTVCGAVPPFDVGLGGKLVISFVAHPDIIDLGRSTAGTVLRQSFDVQSLERFLPREGLLVVTTKGLYSRYSPMYQRSSVPGVSPTSDVKLKHADNTDGTTSTFLSNRTAWLSKQLLSLSSEKGKGQVSWAYGSGGAKRHRALESAASLCGLGIDVVSAGISRPVYSLELAENAVPSIWSLEDPVWVVPRSESPQGYSSLATENWRKRWLKKGKQRARDFAFIPSPLRRMEGADGSRELD